MPRVYVAAGSNIDGAAKLHQALAALGAVFGPLTVSPCYVNAAYGFYG